MKTIEFDINSPQKLKNMLSKLSSGKVLVIGDLMLDTYLIGDSTRISPEAPVPVVKIAETKHVLGGAGNVARAITALGGKSTIIGVVGKDFQAKEMQNLFEKENVNSSLLAVESRSTTIKTRVLARGQQMLRMDMESDMPLSEAEEKEIFALLENELDNFDAVIVSDYAKGCVTKSLMDFLRNYKEKKKNLKIFVDPKPANKDIYHDLFLLTPNFKETSELAGKEMKNLEEVERIGKELREELNLNFLLTTLGAQGMALFSKNTETLHIATTAKQVFDVTGAGDTVIATLALALSVGLSEEEACILANLAAGVVVGKIGSATVTQDEILAAALLEA